MPSRDMTCRIPSLLYPQVGKWLGISKRGRGWVVWMAPCNTRSKRFKVLLHPGLAGREYPSRNRSSASAEKVNVVSVGRLVIT